MSACLLGLTFVVAAIAQTSLWAVGRQGTIMHSSDSGDTWSTQASGTTNDLWAIAARSSAEAWAVGDRGTALYTTNGGATWQARTLGDSGTTLTLKSIVWEDAPSNFGIIVGDQGYAAFTAVGGKFWSPARSVSDKMFNSVARASFMNWFAVGTYGLIARTKDSGLSWQILVSPTPNHLMSVAFSDANNGVAVGSSGTIIRTTDGGTTWNLVSSSTGEEINAVSFTLFSGAWAVTSSASLLRSQDAGASWGTTTLPVVGIAQFFGMSFTTSSAGWLCGRLNPGGTAVLRTLDGGVTWTQLSPSTSNNLFAVSGNGIPLPTTTSTTGSTLATTPPDVGFGIWGGYYSFDQSCSQAQCCCPVGDFEMTQNGDLLSGSVNVAGALCGTQTTILFDGILGSPTVGVWTPNVLEKSGLTVAFKNTANRACSGTMTCTSGACAGTGSSSVCSCWSPIFSCSLSCVNGNCTAMCKVVWWLIVVVVVAGLLIVTGIVLLARRCCCPMCCKRKTEAQKYDALSQEDTLKDHAAL